jgi:hypothetical protein
METNTITELTFCTTLICRQFEIMSSRGGIRCDPMAEKEIQTIRFELEHPLRLPIAREVHTLRVDIRLEDSHQDLDGQYWPSLFHRSPIIIS